MINIEDNNANFKNFYDDTIPLQIENFRYPDFVSITPTGKKEPIEWINISVSQLSQFGDKIKFNFYGVDKTIKVMPIDDNDWHGLIMPLREKKMQKEINLKLL